LGFGRRGKTRSRKTVAVPIKSRLQTTTLMGDVLSPLCTTTPKVKPL
jgi:hypothetical protein